MKKLSREFWWGFMEAMYKLFHNPTTYIVMVILCTLNAGIFLNCIVERFIIESTKTSSNSSFILSGINTLFLLYWCPKLMKCIKDMFRRNDKKEESNVDDGFYLSRLTDSEKLKCLLYGITRDIDGGCYNPNNNCFNCKYNSKCKVMFIKEAFCKIHNGTKSMNNDKWLELRNKYLSEGD